MRVDLHSHSSVSDGTQPPADVVRRAHAAGVTVLALTDHDTVAGHPEAVRALPPGMTLVRGMELSCRLRGRGVHLLAYLFDPAERALAAEVARVRDDRAQRARGMVEGLARLGVRPALRRPGRDPTEGRGGDGRAAQGRRGAGQRGRVQ